MLLPLQTKKPTADKVQVLKSERLADVGDYVQDLAFDARGENLAAAAINGLVGCIDLPHKAWRPLGQHALGCTSLAWHPHAPYLFSSGQDGCIQRFALAADKANPALSPLTVEPPWIEKIAFSAQGKLAAAAGKRLYTWNTPLQEKPEVFGDYPSRVSTILDIAFMPDREELVGVAYGGAARFSIGNVTPERIYAWQGSSLNILPSPTGKYLASSQQDHNVHIWVARTGEDMEMNGFPLKVHAMAWSHDGNWLATGGAQAVTLWNCAGKGPSGRAPVELKGHSTPITALTFIPESRRILSGDEDGRLILWNPTQDKPVLAVGQFPCAITRLAAILWGKQVRVAIGDAAGGVHFLTLEN